MRILAALFLVAALSAQAPSGQEPTQTDPPRHDKYADDPHARCTTPEVAEYYPENKSLHACTCHLVCSDTTNEEGTVIGREQGESSECQMYCSKSRCSCHPDSPCSMPEMPEVKK